MFSGYKTYIMGGVAIIGAAAAYLVGDANLQQTLALIIPAVMGMTIRHGVTTEAAKNA